MSEKKLSDMHLRGNYLTVWYFKHLLSSSENWHICHGYTIACVKAGLHRVHHIEIIRLVLDVFSDAHPWS